MIYLKTFFVWYTHSDNRINRYRSELEQNVYACMEMSKQSYSEVMMMPVQRFYNYLKWKSDLEEEKKKMMAEGFAALKGGKKVI